MRVDTNQHALFGQLTVDFGSNWSEHRSLEWKSVGQEQNSRDAGCQLSPFANDLGAVAFHPKIQELPTFKGSNAPSGAIQGKYHAPV